MILSLITPTWWKVTNSPTAGNWLYTGALPPLTHTRVKSSFYKEEAVSLPRTSQPAPGQLGGRTACSTMPALSLPAPGPQLPKDAVGTGQHCAGINNP